MILEDMMLRAKLVLLMQVIPEDAGPAEREQRFSRDAEDGVHQGCAAVCGARGACAGAHRWQFSERCLKRGHAAVHPGHGACCAVDLRLLYCIPFASHIGVCALSLAMTYFVFTVFLASSARSMHVVLDAFIACSAA